MDGYDGMIQNCCLKGKKGGGGGVFYSVLASSQYTV